MKIDLIQKFQQGGGVYIPPFAVYQPLPHASENVGATQAEEAKSSKADLTDSDVLKMLEKVDGLPNDMEVITRELRNFYIDRMAPGRLSGSSSTNTAVRYISLINQIKVANFNKKEYDNAWQEVTQHGGLDELAIDDRGKFICIDKDGNFKRMSPEELRTSDGEYTALTNNDLLNYRAQDLSVAFKNDVLNVVRRGIGIAEVTKQIQDVISKIGTTTENEPGYISTKQGRIIQGLEDFGKAVIEASGNVPFDGTVNDLYKYNLLTKEQTTKAKEAMAYIFNTLSPAAKSLLMSKAGLTEEGARELVATLISSKLDDTRQFSLDLIGGKTYESLKRAENAGKKADGTDLKSTQLVNIVRSFDGVRSPMMIDRGDGIQMTLVGRQFNLLLDPSGSPVGATSLEAMLGRTGIQGIVKNMNNITFGDQKIPREALKNITYNNTGAIRVNLPIKADGSVNFEYLDAFLRVEEKIDALGRDPRPEDYTKFMEEEGLTALLKPDGTINQDKFGAFLVTEGFTTDKLSGIQESDFVKEYSGNTDLAIQTITSSLREKTGSKVSEPKIDKKSIWPGDWFGWYDKIYKAAIYIPIDNSILAAARLDGQKLDMNEAEVYERAYQDQDKIFNFRPDSTDISILRTKPQ